MQNDALEHLNTLLDRDIELKEKIKDRVHEFDKAVRTVVGALNRIHSTPADSMPALLETVRPMRDACADSIASIAALVPAHEYWRWNGMWTNSLRSATFAVLLIEYLGSGGLLSQPEVSSVLKIKVEWKDRFTLQAEDYLHGLINLVNELSRWAVNAVTLGDFEQPVRISAFVKDLFAGFSMLNLKNDLLRRRFDSLKYDIKKIEEVVYDVSLRRLVPSIAPTDGQPPSATPTS